GRARRTRPAPAQAATARDVPLREAGGRGLEPLAIADDRRVDTHLRPRLPAAVEGPARGLVEPASPRVVLEHPENGLVEAARAKVLLGRRKEAAADACSPRRRIDVDRVDLAELRLVGGALGEDEAEDRVAGDEADRVVVLETALPARDARLERKRVQLVGRKDAPVGGLPRAQVHQGDRLRILDPRPPHLDLGHRGGAYPG